MGRSTRATRFLAASGAAFTLHEYAYDAQAAQTGLQAAHALGIAPERLLKTLMVVIDGRPSCAILPADAEMSMKRLAAAVGAKSASMMARADAERAAGYVTGGISPFGQRRAVAAVLEERASRHPTVFVNGGRRGLQLELAPATIIRLLGATSARIVR